MICPFSVEDWKCLQFQQKKVVMGTFGDGNFSSSIAALTSLLSEFLESQVKSSQVPNPLADGSGLGIGDPV